MGKKTVPVTLPNGTIVGEARIYSAADDQIIMADIKFNNQGNERWLKDLWDHDLVGGLSINIREEVIA